MAEFEASDLAAVRDAVKLYARVVQTGEDALIEGLAAGALVLCEAFCRRITIARQAVEVLPCSSEWQRLSAAPVQAITVVEGFPAEGGAFPFPVEDYAVDIDAEGVGWVRVTAPGSAGRARVTYEAGIASAWDSLPEALRQGIVRLATHMHVHRDDPRESAPPAAVAALWRPWRVLHLSNERARGCSTIF